MTQLENDKIKILAESGVITTTGEIVLGGARMQIAWDTDLVPSETITWLEKHGPLKDAVIQTERPSSLETGYFVQTLDSYKSTDYTLLVLENGGENMRWLVFSKSPSFPVSGFWNDSEIWDDTNIWID